MSIIYGRALFTVIQPTYWEVPKIVFLVVYNQAMKSQLQKNYHKYKSSTSKGKTNLSYLRSFMAEIIFRTTKLEGELVRQNG